MTLGRDLLTQRTTALTFGSERRLPLVALVVVVGGGPGGLKVAAESGWFAARPSGTESIYKIYAESFRGTDHLHQIQEEAQTIVSAAMAASP